MTNAIKDIYRVLPHRDVDESQAFAGAPTEYMHRPCGMPLSRADVVEANWCHHCAATINKAARARGRASIDAA